MATQLTYEQLLQQNERLQQRIGELEDQLRRFTTHEEPEKKQIEINNAIPYNPEGLTAQQIARYGRQLIMSEIGVKGQKKICDSSVLIVGGGGLGSSAALYLAGAGIGRIGIVDYDTVEASNLHRQIIHNEQSIGVPKAISARDAVRRFNSLVSCTAYVAPFTSGNALELVSQYDIVVDASDNVPTRYLCNDACVLLKKTLVSGAALRMDGQCTVYHYKNGPCYRCLFPTPPPADTVTDCSNGGVLGVVPGIIGCLQALEVIKIVAGVGDPLAQKLLLFDALTPRFTTVKLRPRVPSCAVCGDNPTIHQLIDYEMFCQSAATDKPTTRKIIDENLSITCQEYQSVIHNKIDHVLLDVRETVQYEICALNKSWNIPLRFLGENMEAVKERAGTSTDKPLPVYVVCRRGNDSQIAVQRLLDAGVANVKNIAGGVQAWANEVDKHFPVY